MTIVYKSLRKVLESRDLLVLKLLPDIQDKKLSESVLRLINERNRKSKISYDDAIRADLELHRKLKILYEQINKMKKNEVQEELFRRIIDLEKRLKLLRTRYSATVRAYNMSLTIHPKIFVKILHMKPLDLYGKKE
ncbi:MAG: LemA family protein [Clostridia bacterium]|nr:LemA family protein [Clostridia bacterium]